MTIFDFLGRLRSKTYHEFYICFLKLFPVRGSVYMLHSVGDDRHKLSVSKEAFELFLKKINKKKCVRLEEWEKSNNFCCLTFDDVADSFYYNAYPLLKEYGIPFTIFVSCSLLDKEKYLTTEMLKEIADCDLCTIGSHGWKHVYYSSFNEKEAKQELSLSKSYLEKLTGKEIGLFAFPHGTFYTCGYTRKSLVNMYYKYGFSSVATPIKKPKLLPNYFLPRICVSEELINKM